MTDLLPPPAILKTPTWYGGPDDETALPLEPGHYAVQQLPDETNPANHRTIVSVKATGEIVYNGIGPADVVFPPKA